MLITTTYDNVKTTISVSMLLLNLESCWIAMFTHKTCRCVLMNEGSNNMNTELQTFQF